MESSRGTWKLSQLDEHVPVSCNTTFEYSPNQPVSPIKGFEDPNFPLKLSTCSPKPFLPFIPPKLCTLKAYGSTSNPTSNYLASSSYVSQWRSVVRWKTNGADLLPIVRCKKNDQDSGRNAYELCIELSCLDENAVLNMNLSFLRLK